MNRISERERQTIHQAAAILGRLGGKIGGKARTPSKVQASRENGRLSQGRPRKPWHQLSEAGKYARRRREQSGKEKSEGRHNANLQTNLH